MAEKTESPVSTLDLIVQGAQSYFDATIIAAEIVAPEAVLEDVEAVGELGGVVGGGTAVLIAGFEGGPSKALDEIPSAAAAFVGAEQFGITVTALR